MKPIVLGVIAVVVIGGVWMFLSNDTDSREAASPAAPAAETVETPTPEPAVAETEVTSPAVENDAAMEETSAVPAEPEAAAEPAATTPAAEAEPVVSTPEPVSVPEAVTFNLTGDNFDFSETEMRVEEGQTVTVNFTSTGGFHDWVVDEFSAATGKVSAGNSTSVTFVADKKGTFEYYCSVGSHRAQGMVGNLIVE